MSLASHFVQVASMLCVFTLCSAAAAAVADAGSLGACAAAAALRALTQLPPPPCLLSRGYECGRALVLAQRLVSRLVYL